MEQIQSFFVGLQNVFRNFQLKDVVDILLVAVIIYGAVRLMRETRAAQLAKGIIIVLVVWLLAVVCQLNMMTNMLTYLVQYGLVFVAIVFQPELRSGLEKMGRGSMAAGVRSLFAGRATADEAMLAKKRQCIRTVVDACDNMSKTKTGALIVFERNTKLGDIIATGTVIDAAPSVPMLCNIFFNKAPLHDGAMVIRDGKVHAAGCILPLTKRNEDVAVELGTRHRAAIGMSENSDAVVVVVSEETGQISVALEGRITRNYSRETLENQLSDLLLDAPAKEKKKSAFFASVRRQKHEKE